MLYVDGLTTNGGSRVGLTMVSLEGHFFEHALKSMFKVSNNEAEYEALLADMEICNVLRTKHVKAFFDS